MLERRKRMVGAASRIDIVSDGMISSFRLPSGSCVNGT